MKIRMLFLVLCVTFMALPINSTAQTMNENVSYPSQNEIIEKAPRADVIQWRYKFVDGKRYRRQYNLTKNVWIGEWEAF